MTIRDYFNQNIQIKIGDIITFTNEDVVSNSITFNGTMINNLQAGSSRFQFSVKPSDKTDTLLKYKDKLSAEVLIGKPNDEGTIIYSTIFKGYLSNKITTDVKRYGFDAMALTIEDPTTGLLKTEVFPNSLVTHYVEGTLSNIIDTYYKGIIINKSNAVKQDARVVGRVVKVGETLESLLKDLCYELGYSYYWSGVALEFYRFDDQKTSAITDIIDYSKLAANKTTAVNINKDIRKYSSIRVEGDIYEEVSNVLIYRDISGSSDNVNANITVKAGQYYPPQSSTENPTIVKCEKDLDTGKEIINIEEITPNIVASSSSLKSTIAIASNNTLSVCLYNPTSSNIIVTRLECSAKVKRLASTDIVKVADNNDKAETYEKKVTCIHNTSYLEDLADNLIQYYKYADNTYIFFVEDDDNSVTNTKAKYPYPLFLSKGLVGKAVTIKDDVVSGLQVNVVVTSVIIDTSSNLIKYQGVGFSNLEFDKSIIKTNVTIPDDPTQGPAGPKGDKGDTGPQGPKGDQGEPGTPADTRTFYLTSKEVVIDRRQDTYSSSLDVYASNYSETEIAKFTAKLTITYSGVDPKTKTLANPTIVKLSDTEYRISYSIVETQVREYYPLTLRYTVTDSKGSSQYIDIGVVDATVYNKYLGTVDNLPEITSSSKYFDGDGIFDKASYILYVLENGVWVYINSSSLTDGQKSTMLGYAQKDILSTIPAGSVTSSDYAYFNTLITDTIIASQLTMTDTGIIQSLGIDDTKVGSDGYLTTQGYRLEGDAGNGKGILRATYAYIEDIHGKNGTLVNISVEGELKGRYINTVAPSSETTTIKYTYPQDQKYYKNYEMRMAIVNSFKPDIIKKPSSQSYNVVDTPGTYGSASFNGIYFSYSPGSINRWGIVDGLLRLWTDSGDNIGSPTTCPLYPNSDYTLFEGNNYIIPEKRGVNSSTITGGYYGGFNGSSVKKYCMITTAVWNNFSSLPQGIAVNASGTVTVGATTLNGNFTIVRGSSSITIIKDKITLTIPGPGGVVEYALSVDISFNTTKEGIEVYSIYPSSDTSDIGSSGSKFRTAYISDVEATSINANSASIITINGTTITGTTVWGAVAN